MALSHAAATRRTEYNRRYRAEHYAAEYPRCRARREATVGKLCNLLANAEWRHRRRATKRLAATIARLAAEIERLRGVKR